ncbi:acetoacetate decarboxylase family protein [Rhizobium leguminosarum]|uniref:acetoacetate decarboxylase family protein n=1 Tax=Rhizobium leguminosarum TaxID=384 RepID=UPI003F9BDB3D
MRQGCAGRHARLWRSARRHRNDGLQASVTRRGENPRKPGAAEFHVLKIIPHVDCTPRICELVRYYLEDLTVKGAWEGPFRKVPRSSSPT